MWTLRSRPSRWRSRLVLSSTVLLSGVTLHIAIQAWWQHWPDYLWAIPLLMLAALLCWQQAGAEPRALQWQLHENGQGLDTLSGCCFQVQADSLLLPWLVVVHVRQADAPDYVASLNSAWMTSAKTRYIWVWQDQLSMQDWARLRRVCLNVRHQGH